MSDRLRTNLIVVGIALLLLIAYIIRATVLLIYVSIIFAVIFNPVLDWVEKQQVRGWSPSRGTALLILVAVVLLALGLIMGLALPPLIRDTQAMAKDLPAQLHQLSGKLDKMPFGSAMSSHLDAQSLQSWVQSGVKNSLKVFSGVFSSLLALLTLILLTAYFMLDGKRSFDWAMSMVPEPHRNELRTTLVRSQRRLQRWLAGQAILMLILGSSAAVTFGIMGLRYAYFLALFAGLANFVPILGPIATVVLAGLVAATQSWMMLLGVVIFYLVYQQVENAYLTPRIMRSTVGLPGVAVIAALAIGGALAGILGAMVAVPTAALLATVLHDYAVKQDAKVEQLRAA